MREECPLNSIVFILLYLYNVCKPRKGNKRREVTFVSRRP